MPLRRLPFELASRAAAALTAHGGLPLLIEALPIGGAAAVVDERVAIKRRQRARPPAPPVAGRCLVGRGRRARRRPALAGRQGYR